MKPEEYTERVIEVNGWPVRLTSYRLGAEWHTKADNVSPGAALARVVAASKEDAETRALARAAELLGRTRRQEVRPE